MNPADTQLTVDHYTMLLQEHGPDKPEAVGWCAENQSARFNLLMSSSRFPEGFRVLDYGCGKGDLLDWITVSPKVAEHAVRQQVAHEVRFPHAFAPKERRALAHGDDIGVKHLGICYR